MLKLVKECIPWLNWQTGIIAVLAIVGIMACTELPDWRMFAGVMPLLIVATCLLPCLIPLALLRRNKADKATVTVSRNQE